MQIALRQIWTFFLMKDNENQKNNIDYIFQKLL